jgi:hypothetical protein
MKFFVYFFMILFVPYMVITYLGSIFPAVKDMPCVTEPVFVVLAFIVFTIIRKMHRLTNR